MINWFYFILIILLANGQLIQCETQQDAASYARYLVETQTVGTFATVNNKNGYPLASLSDFSESYEKDGSLVFLLAEISNVARNLEKNPMCSFLLNVGNCSSINCDHLPCDPLACPRVTFNGECHRSENPLDSKNPNYSAFIEKHPAAFYWVNYSPHTFHLWTFDMQEIYYVGGYGNLHYIGPIDLDVYRQSQPVPPQ